jgi:two-component system sensor histidine kinase EvgS
MCNGYEATRKIREFNKDIPILALTADVVGDSRTKCTNSGMDDFLSKPMTLDKMKTVISQFFVL